MKLYTYIRYGDLTMQINDIHGTILDEIGKIPGMKSYAGDSILVCCPFHADNSPSCGIYTSVGMDIPLGAYHCFGCGAKGRWNSLAQRAGLIEIPDWQISDAGDNSSSGLAALYHKLENRTVTHPSIKSLMKSLKRNSYMSWPDDVGWRGYPGSLVASAEGQLCIHPNTGESLCFFPCAVGSKYIGGVAAYMQKQAGGTSYVNTSGTWSKEKGLFPLKLVRSWIRKKGFRYVVLVEGPRDALALLSYGIPALAVLGSEQFGDSKRQIIEMLDLDCVFTMVDNDKGGDLLRKNIKESFKSSGIQVMHFKLPKDRDAKGRLIKLDPDNAPKKFIREAKGYLRGRYGKGCFIPSNRLGWSRVK